MKIQVFLLNCLSGSFSPGQLLDRAIESGLTVSPQELIEKVIGLSHQHIQAEFHEGYWLDHWTYSLDLIDSFLNVYPDRKDELLYTSEPLPFFDSTMMVNPRSRKYTWKWSTTPIKRCNWIEEKENLLNDRKHGKNWVRSNYGQGEIFQFNLFSKLIFLSIIKFSTRDPHGMGIEMEAGRPAWCDALNGLPGIWILHVRKFWTCPFVRLPDQRNENRGISSQFTDWNGRFIEWNIDPAR